MEYSRRVFLKNSLLTTGVAGTMKPSTLLTSPNTRKRPANICISRVNSNFEREPLVRPFGFKGNYGNEIWQSIIYLESSSGAHGIGLGTQSVLWSDSQVFAEHSESGGNAIMFALTDRALRMIKGQYFKSPVELIDNILPEIFEFGKKITCNPNLRKTFVLNSLVGIDNAAWLLFSKENGIDSYDEMIPQTYRPALSQHHDKVTAIPLITYNIPIDGIKALVNQGYFFMKIKIGQQGTQEEMLEKDKERFSTIHKAISHIQTPDTIDGKLLYYLDANGRYEKKETLMKLLDHAKKIGAFEQIAIIEEPFDEESDLDVSDIPVRLASDESAHTDKDAIRRIQMGYKAVALKAIAKTLSMTLKIAQVAFERNVPCFCADLTVTPILVEWNKNVAARLTSFPGLEGHGLLESNGPQNYSNWKALLSYHPRNGASWIDVNQGLYELNEDFYHSGGGIFDPIPHFENMFTGKT